MFHAFSLFMLFSILVLVAQDLVLNRLPLFTPARRLRYAFLDLRMGYVHSGLGIIWLHISTALEVLVIGWCLWCIMNQRPLQCILWWDH